MTNTIPTRPGRPPIGKMARSVPYDMAVSPIEAARLDALPGGSRANRVMYAVTRLDEVTAALRELLSVMDDADATARDYEVVAEAARRLLAQEEGR